MDPLYGRAEIIERARASVDRACGGDGRLVLLTGEPGIGKSTLAEHLAAHAAARRARVAWGRCWEAGGAPAYWPWIQVFRELGMDDDPFAGAMTDVAMGATEARFAAFDRAVVALKAKALQAPVALVLDDLHAADAPSLLLLLLLARQLRGSPMLVVGAYRDAEVRLTPEIAPLLAKVARESEVLPLPRLAPEDVAVWVREAVTDASASRAAELYRLTEGHPLFVVESLRLARGAGPHPPAGLGALLDEHLSRLSAGTRAVLEVAAVLGRDFSTIDVAATAGIDLDLVHEALTDAIASSVVLPSGDPGQFRFSHVLLRDRIYAELPPSARAKLHFCAGTTILARDDQALVAAVHHLFEGQGAGSCERIAEVAAAASEASLSRLAFEDAARLARRALRLPTCDGMPGPLQGRLQLALAESLIRLGEAKEGQALCIQAGELAERIGAHDLLARAALIYGTELVSGILDPQMISLLRRALAPLDDADSPLRARLLARLAAALTPPVGPESMSEILGFMRAATAMARRIGDRHTLLYVLQFAATVGLLVPEEERFSIMQETVERATVLDQRLVLLQCLPGYITALLARGERAAAEAMLPRYDELLAESRQPLQRVHRNLVQALFAALRGDLDEAHRVSTAALLIAEQSGSDSGVRLWLGQRVSFALFLGKPELLGKDAAAIVAHFERISSGVAYAAWTLVGLGRREEAAARLRAINLEPMAVPSANLMELLGTADTSVLLGDTELGQTIYPRLLRAADRMFWNIGPGTILGPTARTLGDLARMIGRVPEALRHYDEAIAFCEKLGAPLLVELCQVARTAVARGSSDARAEAAHASKTPRPDSSAKAFELERQGDFWAITAPPGPTCRLKHSKGLGYLHYLVEHPDREVHVLELAGIEHAAGDAGPLLDARAKAEYRQRLDDLRDELAEAERFADPLRAGRIEAEMAAIAEQLAGAVGLGGRDRVAVSTVERTRINVQRCLKDAIERIAAADPALGRYLSAAIKSGTYCAYHPL